MTLIHTRQAQSFLEPDATLYNRPPAHQLVAFMVRASGAVRSTSMDNRTSAIMMLSQGINEAWAKIHRAMRPYFFTNIDHLFDGYAGMPLPDLQDMPHIHHSMHFCFDVLVDLDRATALLQNDPSVEDVSQEVFNIWMAVYRATSRIQRVENRILTGKAFNGNV